MARGWIWKDLCGYCKLYENQTHCYCSRWYKFKLWLVTRFG